MAQTPDPGGGEASSGATHALTVGAGVAAVAVVALSIPSRGLFAANVLAALAAGALAGSLRAASSPRWIVRARSIVAAGLAGAACAAAFFAREDVWFNALVAGAVALAVGVAMPDVGGATRRQVAIRAGLAVLVGAAPGAMVMAARGLGSIAHVLPLYPASWAATEIALAVAFLLAVDGARPDVGRGARRPAFVLVALAWALATSIAVARVAFVASFASLPADAHHFEGVFLMDQLKLAQGRPLYGPARDLDAYVYSPLHTLIHYGLTRPFGATLALGVHRAICLGEQAATAAWAVWAIRPFARGIVPRAGSVWLGLVLLVVALSSWLAATVHPDHGLGLACAVGFAVALRPEAFGRARLPLLVALPAFAFATKLTGVGLGVGLLAVALRERDRRGAAVAAIGLAVAAATVPLFDATLGEFSFWAIRVQAARPWDGGQIRVFLENGFVMELLALAVVAVLSAASGRLTAGDGRAATPAHDQALARAGVLAACIAATTVPTFFKYTARDNVLVPAALAIVVLLALLGARLAARGGAVAHPFVAVVALLAVPYSQVRPRLPLPAELRGGAIADFDHVVAVIRADAAAGRSTLLLAGGAAWVAAGRTEVMRDRFGPAAELSYAGFPEADLLVAHLADGRYDTIVASPRLFVADGGRLQTFNERVADAIRGAYDLEVPPGGLRSGTNLVFRRRRN